jgi:hypothetical protein
MMDGFFTDGELLRIYNRAFATTNLVKDEDLRHQMLDVFSKFRAVNREWRKLVNADEKAFVKTVAWG